MAFINVTNIGLNPITITDAFTSTSEIEIFLDEDQTFPVRVGSNQSSTIKVVITAENIGRFESVIYFAFEKKIYVMTVIANVAPNKFGLEPIYYP